MQYKALATDYDGTLATDGKVDETTLTALSRLRDSGGKLILVTGRRLEELLQTFPQIELFDRAVLENGALLYRPATGEEKALGDRPSEKFIQLLQERGVTPAVGRVIVATWLPYENTVLQTIQELKLELQIILNKDAVMVLPAGINKATGLNAALAELEISTDETVAVGDAENDLDFMNVCGCAVAVANALPMVKERADLVTKGARGAGVVELIEQMISNDLSEIG